MSNILILALVIGISMLLSFLFSGMEAGVLALNHLRIRQLMRSGKRSAQVLHGYLEKSEDFLWTILVGNTLANLLAVGLMVILLRRELHGHPLWMVACFLAGLLVFYAFCELLPKMIFRTLPNRLTLALTVPFRFFHLALSPLVWVLTRLARNLLNWTGGGAFSANLFGSREEMRLVMQESAQGLTSEERVMINRVLDLQNLSLRQITIPIANAVTLNTTTRMAEALQLARDKKVTRMPVWQQQGGARRIAGIISLRSVLYDDLDLSKTAGDYLKPALYLEEDLRLEAALKRMRRGGQGLAIVLGPDRREVGIVSLQDILKMIFGEVRL